MSQPEARGQKSEVRGQKSEAGKEKDLPELWQEPALRNYWLISLGSLLVVTFTLLQRQLGLWSLLPILLGSLSLAFRWRVGPILVLAALGWLLFSERLNLSPFDLLERTFLGLVQLIAMGRSNLPPERWTFGVGGRFLFSDVFLCGATLAGFAAHCRLVGLTGHLFSVDPRRLTRSSPGWVFTPAVKAGRSEKTVGPQELLLLLVSVPGWVGLAAMIWAWLMEQRPLLLAWPASAWKIIYPELATRGERVPIELPPALWRGMLLVWGLGLGVIVVAGIVSYLGLRRMSPEEANLVLQDTLWRETCREQRLLHRWLARARLRRPRREEKS